MACRAEAKVSARAALRESTPCGNGNQHLRIDFDILGKAAGQIADPRGSPVHPAELLFAGKAIGALPAVSGTNADPRAHGRLRPASAPLSTTTPLISWPRI